MAGRVSPPHTAPFVTSRRARETEAVRDPRHLAWIRELPCVISGRSGCEAAHVSFADRRYGKPERAKGRKSGDDWTLPLHPDVHRDQHAHGERAWWQSHGIDATALATRLWAVSGDTEAALLILATARDIYARPLITPIGSLDRPGQHGDDNE